MNKLIETLQTIKKTEDMSGEYAKEVLLADIAKSLAIIADALRKN